MKRLIFMVCWLLCAMGARAGLTWEKLDVELSAKPGDEELRAVFPFKNDGNTTVEIVKLKSSCGCTVAQQDKKSYGPGESGKITAIFRPGSRVGLQEKVVAVQTDDASQSRPTFLKLIVNIPKALTLEPPALRWNKGEALHAKTIRAKAHPDAPIKMITVDSSLPVVDAGVQAVKGRPGEWDITVKPNPVEESTRVVITIKSDWPAAAPKVFSAFVAVER